MTSTAFNPNIHFPYPYTDIHPDSIIQTSDEVLFHVHRDRLQTRSRTAFDGLFTDNSTVGLNRSLVVFLVPEDATVMNCVLHILYGTSSRIYCPDFETIAQAFETLQKYGCRLSECIPQDSEIFTDLVCHAAEPNTDALKVYTLAASHDFEELAVQCSYYALRIPISRIDEGSSIMMGPLYLLRLLRLHASRRAALHRLLMEPPERHEDTPFCNWRRQIGTTRAYGLIAGYLTWEAPADASATWITTAFERVIQCVECPRCQINLWARVLGVIRGWNDVKKTI
ncbi:uncharacterized protein EI90DRAFT_2918900 [Cantharellus anzutake]|uniref:uncharacterized protein n=1 Tax=Cantharellus anzutake TaxID=1750568 RepID=UPI0019048C4A|nr:uncharacterized protein EI90DRAFT_2918900 [Cantharellus anzutake]KAF8332238.1 hypothetical protein EI90DRAFT_2918900 [Cantharellus anzutake]